MKKTTQKKIEKNKKIIYLVCSLIIIACVVAAAVIHANKTVRESFNIYNHLEDTLISVNDSDISLREAAYYIIKMEGYVDEAARIYDSENPEAYWNMYINNRFVRTLAKETCLSIITRDNVYYLAAVKEGLVLSEDARTSIAEEVQNTLMNMTAAQMELTKYTSDELFTILYKINMAKAYISMVRQNHALFTEEDFNVGGTYYESIVSDYEIDINEELWEDVDVGHVSINVNRNQ